MDGVQGAAFQGAGFGGVDGTEWRPSVIDPARTILAAAPGLCVERIEDVETLVVTKTVPGFSPAVVAGLTALVRAAAQGRLGRLKFLVFDFAHEGFPLSLGAEGFEALVAETSNLILAAPVITVAAARSNMAGADLEFALACSMIVGETARRFSFAADPTVSVGAYGLLAQKIGFVRAERLMEKGDIIGAAEMEALFLLKETLEDAPGAIEAFVRKTARRHNACCGIYRAQRIALKPTHDGMRA